MDEEERSGVYPKDDDGRRRPLAEATQRRIAAGRQRFLDTAGDAYAESVAADEPTARERITCGLLVALCAFIAVTFAVTAALGLW